MGSLLVFSTWETPVNCAEAEFAIFDAPGGQTCGEYLSSYMAGMGSAANLLNPDVSEGCRVCQYTMGTDYLMMLNLLSIPIRGGVPGLWLFSALVDMRWSMG